MDKMNDGEMREAIRRAELEHMLKTDCLSTISDRVTRYLELDFIKITPNTHFASISAECMLLYRDGYFFACIALCQAVDEAIVRLICERNGMGSPHFTKFETNIRKLKKLKNKVPPDWVEMFERIWENRNDYHHLNPEVPTQKEKLREIAKDKIVALVNVESKVFAYDMAQGAINPKYPQYWPKLQKGLLNVFLRFEP